MAGDTCLCSCFDILELFLARKELARLGKIVERFLENSYLAGERVYILLLSLYPGMGPFGLLVNLPLSDCVELLGLSGSTFCKTGPS